jgi:hypothetical protein
MPVEDVANQQFDWLSCGSASLSRCRYKKEKEYAVADRREPFRLQLGRCRVGLLLGCGSASLSRCRYKLNINSR